MVMNHRGVEQMKLAEVKALLDEQKKESFRVCYEKRTGALLVAGSFPTGTDDDQYFEELETALDWAHRFSVESPPEYMNVYVAERTGRPVFPAGIGEWERR